MTTPTTFTPIQGFKINTSRLLITSGKEKQIYTFVDDDVREDFIERLISYGRTDLKIFYLNYNEN